MSAKPSRPSPAEPAPAPPVSTARPLAVLAGLGFLAALWSLFLWSQLVLSRSGGTPVCGFTEGAHCGALWDSPAAVRLHDATGLPVAGWGLAWSLVAFALSLLGLFALAEGRPLSTRLLSALRWTAVGGVLAVALFVGISLSVGIFCLGCAIEDVLVVAYAAVVWTAWRRVRFQDVAGGLALAGVSTAVAVTVLLYPGLHTPPPSEEAGRRALAAGAASPGGSPAGPAAPSGSRDPEREKQIADFVATLSPKMKQATSDALAEYRSAPVHAPAPRSLSGPAEAPVRITAFTDVLCPHCAELHKTLNYLRETAPPGSFQIDSRQFPLDAACNPAVRRSDSDPVRCLGAKAAICLEGQAGAFEFGGALLENQRSLSVDKVFALAEPYISRSALQACVASDRAQARIEEDAREVSQHAFEGTPLVLVNGRKVAPFAPLLYVLILSGGDASPSALAALPPPSVHGATGGM